MKSYHKSRYSFLLLLFLLGANPAWTQTILTNAGCGFELLQGSGPSSQALARYDYVCTNTPAWPTCKDVTIPVYGVLADPLNGRRTVTKQDFETAITTLNSQFSGTGFRFREVDFRYEQDDDLHIMDAALAPAKHIQYGEPYAITLYITENVYVMKGGNRVYKEGVAIGPWDGGHALFVARARVGMASMAHEMGHVLGLLHTHETKIEKENVMRPPSNPFVSDACVNCEVAGDLLCDTPADDRLGGNCSPGPVRYDACNSSTYAVDVTNFMSYYDVCRNSFTPGQVDRMKCWYDRTYKGKLGSNVHMASRDHDFENGLTPWQSDLDTQQGVGNAAGTIEIGNNPQALNPYFSACLDHTPGGDDMLVVNGATTANRRVIYRSIVVQPFTWYKFSVHATAVHPDNIPRIQLKVNGQILQDDPGALPTSTCTWRKISGYWFSGMDCSARMSVYGTSTASHGNDFALDDISFQESTPRPIGPISKVAGTMVMDEAVSLQLFPNPAEQYVTLRLELLREREISYTIVDMQGRSIYQHASQQLPAGTQTIRWERPAGIPAGMYLVRIQVGADVRSERLMLR